MVDVPTQTKTFSAAGGSAASRKYNALQSSPACSHFHTLWLFLHLLSGATGELVFSPHLYSECTVMRAVEGQSLNVISPVPLVPPPHSVAISGSQAEHEVVERNIRS